MSESPVAAKMAASESGPRRRRFHTSAATSLVFLAACLGAIAGWTGARLPAPQAQAAERPTTGSLALSRSDTGARGVAGAAAPATGAQNGGRAAWQPSPVAGKKRVQPSGQAALVPPPAAVSSGVAPAATLIPAAGSLAPASADASAPAAAATLSAAEVERARADAAAAPALTASWLESAFGGGLPPRRGAWREERFFSHALGQEATYLVWLPPGYEARSVPLPVLYLLHGAGGLQASGAEEWLEYGLAEDLDRLLALGLIEPMIVVLPNGEQGYWMNHAGGGPKWADFVAQDLVAHVDGTFHTDPTRERRAVGGLSMGGHGALQLSLNWPDVFAVAGAHSPTLRPFDESPDFFGDLAWFSRYDPLWLARTTGAALRVITWIDVGTDDGWRLELEALRRVYEAQSAPLRFRVLEGGHESEYWATYLPEYLRFYSSALAMS